ncbi:LacI family DNA-binding transcriptional regulator [Plantactinospora sp. BB1]|uniref:LacI family DNA-binding transcriptional regulator n=1 Tax=Plantactinospora sp. BB1 TaxID=2071627 RepID=UPI0018FE7C6C|nr:LacI family DNA-binding transcriptional regulator [Plantactinospora sp. BB1]
MQPRQPTTRRVTMTDVARAAGVSPMTVSYTYNRPERVSEESRSRVLRTAAALGYPGPDPSARSLRYGVTRTLGVVLGEHLSYAFDDPQAVAFLAGIAEVCAERGYGLLIVPTGTGDEDAGRVVAAPVDAYVVWTTTGDDPALAAACGTRRPVVVHGGPGRDGTTLVGIDNRGAARAVGAEVFATARRPAVLSFPVDRQRDTFVRRGVEPDTVGYPVTRDRLAGYRDAAEELGIDWSEVPVGVCRTNDEAEARSVMRHLLAAAPDLDAVAAMSDRLALAALREAADPVRISGWDDSDVAREHGLTTVAQSLRAQGTACATAALGDPAPDHRDDWRLVRRASTGG